MKSKKYSNNKMHFLDEEFLYHTHGQIYSRFSIRPGVSFRLGYPILGTKLCKIIGIRRAISSGNLEELDIVVEADFSLIPHIVEHLVDHMKYNMLGVSVMELMCTNGTTTCLLLSN